MKSNIILSSTDRELFGVTIKQNTKEQFLSVTDLQKSYDFARWQYGWSDRGVNTIMQSKDFKERVFYLLESQGFIKVGIPTFMEMCENEGVVKVLKGLGLWSTKGRGSDKSVYCNPYIWVLLAMELNPMIYAKVIVWLTDSLVFDRIEAGSEYMPMNASIKRIVEKPDYIKIATTINEKVFGRHISGMRQLASAKELRKIADIEKFIKNAIDNGWIKSENQVIEAIKNYN